MNPCPDCAGIPPFDQDVAARFREIGFLTRDELTNADCDAIAAWIVFGGTLIFNSSNRRFRIKFNTPPTKP